MKMSIYAIILLAAGISAQSVLAEQPKPTQKEQEMQQVAPTLEEYDKHLMLMQENIKQMQSQMEKIRQTQNPQERQNLLQQHWATMQNSMGMMRGMWNAGRMGCCMNGERMRHGMMDGTMKGWGKMRGYYSKLTPEQQKQHQYMRDQHMGMQQMMMEHMMHHQHWLNQPTPANK